MKKNNRKWKIAILGLALAIIALAMPFQEELASNVQFITKADVIVLDAGHGGIDGGAESAAGICEKDINLAIVMQIKKLAEKDGFRIVLTRDEDEGLYGNEKKAIRSLKTEDLRARKEIIDKTEPLMAVSIHLNSFKQDPAVRGAQVFYSTGGDQEMTEQGKHLAESIQQKLVEGINDGTNRTALGKRDVLLMKNPAAPTVIIECGFLSNREEANLLEDEAYQKKLAESIYKGMLEYSGLKPKVKLKTIDSKQSA